MAKEGMEWGHGTAAERHASEQDFVKNVHQEELEKSEQAFAAKREKLQAELAAIEEKIAQAEAKMQDIMDKIQAGEKLAMENPKVAKIQATLKAEYNNERIALYDEVQRLKTEQEMAKFQLEFHDKSRSSSTTRTMQ